MKRCCGETTKTLLPGTMVTTILHLYFALSFPSTILIPARYDAETRASASCTLREPFSPEAVTPDSRIFEEMLKATVRCPNGGECSAQFCPLRWKKHQVNCVIAVFADDGFPFRRHHAYWYLLVGSNDVVAVAVTPPDRGKLERQSFAILFVPHLTLEMVVGMVSRAHTCEEALASATREIRWA